MKPAPYRCVTIALPLAVAALACGQVTGLSNDYQFDLVDGGRASTTDSGDARSSDGTLGDTSVDAGNASDANACTPQATALALTTMSSTNGTATCQTCLASSCCGDVQSCAAASDCKKVFECKLDCTSQGDRAPCQNRCANSGVPASYTSGIGACGGRSCKQECGFP